jgi:hypothetical protein
VGFRCSVDLRVDLVGVCTAICWTTGVAGGMREEEVDASGKKVVRTATRSFLPAAATWMYFFLFLLPIAMCIMSNLGPSKPPYGSGVDDATTTVAAMVLGEGEGGRSDAGRTTGNEDAALDLLRRRRRALRA